MTNLAQVTSGRPAKVVSIEGGKDLRRRLQNLGLREGAVVKKERKIYYGSYNNFRQNPKMHRQMLERFYNRNETMWKSNSEAS